MNSKNSIKVYFVMFILMLIIVGGFIAMKYSENYFSKDEKEEQETEKIDIEIRLDDTKDYIYFENNEQIVSELDIEYKDIVINFNDSNNIASSLNSETKTFKDAIVYDENLEQYNKLSRAEYKIYEIYYFDNYISLVVKYYNFDSENLVSFEKTKTYVFDKLTGNLFTEDQLLEKFEKSKDDVKDIVRAFVEDAQVLKEEEHLDVDATLQNLNEYSLYVDKMGKLSLSIIVKSDIKDYNDIVTLN